MQGWRVSTLPKLSSAGKRGRQTCGETCVNRCTCVCCMGTCIRSAGPFLSHRTRPATRLGVCLRPWKQKSRLWSDSPILQAPGGTPAHTAVGNRGLVSGGPGRAVGRGAEPPPQGLPARPAGRGDTELTPRPVTPHITMAVPPQPGLGRGARGAPTLVQGQPGGAMGTPRDKRSATLGSEPDAARIPLLEQRSPGAPRWNYPQGEMSPHPGPKVTWGPTGSRRGWVPLPGGG